MQPREKIIVEASGKPGTHGFQYYGERDGVAPAGRRGANGRSSCNPTDGEHGQDIHIKLCEPKTPGVVVVKGMNKWADTNWEVTNDQILLLDCHGGVGGDGGRGEDGQQGGAGAHGRNATKYRDAEHGGMGARGGDGGYGSNGAVGGDAGNVFIEVDEKDMDLLLPVFWDIKGGKGGASGTHGDPGDGGIGGDGGNGIQWTERYGDHTSHKSRPRGAPGPQGPPGSRPATYLSGGTAGANGSSQVTVMRRDGTQATYPSAYSLKVVSFDIVDENEDGINEPGEHLIVKNIMVENIGGMPSPWASEIKVLIHGTTWLDPVLSEPVFLPNGIKPGETMRVPGEIRAFIMQERSPRGPGQLLHSNDEIQLIATATRLGRTLPDFSGKTNITIRYPLELDAPKHLDCVEKGDMCTFSWVLRNVSTKPYGIQAMLQRNAGTVLSEAGQDRGRVFDFADAEAPGQHKVVDMLEELEPGSEVPISQTFRVSDRAFPYSEAHLKLELMLSEPSRDPSLHSGLATDHEELSQLRSVAWYGMRMQVVGAYSLDPNASFLMVVNAYTVNSIIRQVMEFIQNDLGLAFDIFNVSLNGNLISPVTGKHVFTDYEGKSILLFTNSFPYFSRGNRTVFDLLDPHCAGRLARAGTSFLLLGPNQNQEKAVQWASMLKFLSYSPPTELDDHHSRHAPTKKALHKAMYEGGHPKHIGNHPRHTFPAKKGVFSGADASLDKSAKSTAQSLHKIFPLRRFAVHGSAEDRNGSSAGHVEVFESLPMSSSIRYSLQDFDADHGEVPDFNKFSIISALPFAMRTGMIWNIMRSAGTTLRIDTTDLYQLKSLDPKSQPIVSVTERREIDEKVCRAVFLSVEHDLIQEFSLFNSKVPWPDVLPGPDSLEQLPLLKQFYDVAAAYSMQLPSSEGANSLSQILGTLDAGLASVGFWQAFGRTVLFGMGSRKANLAPQLNKQTQALLASSFTPDATKQIHQSIKAHSTVTKKHLKAAGSTRKGMEDLAQQRIKSYISDGSSTAYIDLPHHHPMTRGTELMSRGEPQTRTEKWLQFMVQVEDDYKAAEVMRREMVTAA